MIPVSMLKMLLPLASSWAQEQEAVILSEGVALTAQLMEDARRIGVRHPERVRLRVVDEVPLPVNPLIRGAAERTGLISTQTAGMTLRYGIFIRSDCWGERRLVVHELAHTAQYERLGGFREFLEPYLMECMTQGYPNGPLEQEACRIAAEICL